MHPMYVKMPAGANLFQSDIIDRQELITTSALAGHHDYMSSRDDGYFLSGTRQR